MLIIPDELQTSEWSSFHTEAIWYPSASLYSMLGGFFASGFVVWVVVCLVFWRWGLGKYVGFVWFFLFVCFFPSPLCRYGMEYSNLTLLFISWCNGKLSISTVLFQNLLAAGTIFFLPALQKEGSFICSFQVMDFCTEKDVLSSHGMEWAGFVCILQRICLS